MTGQAPGDAGHELHRTGLSLEQVRRRYLVVLALRWFPTGILIPTVVLLALDRGLTISQVGVVIATQGVVTLLLELPTGGLSDSLGRRPMLVASGLIGLVALGFILRADTFALFVVAYVLQGTYRALDSGPLESWFVDSSRALQPGADIQSGLARGGAVMGIAVSGGALVAGGLVAWAPLSGMETLAVPVVAAIVVQIANVTAALVLIEEPDFSKDRGALRASVRAVPGVIREASQVIRRSHVLAALIGVEIFWGFGLASFELLTPVKLEELLDSHQAAVAIMGPTASAAWLVSAAGAAAVPLLARTLGPGLAAASLRILHGVTVMGIGVAAGPVAAVVAYLLSYVVHGASNPLHMSLLHERIESGHRTTVISVNSMVSAGSGALGMVVLSAMSESFSVTTAIVVGGSILSVGALLYLPAMRETGPATPADDDPTQPSPSREQT